ncbi:MAG: phospho-N-acetylmuramoyl-pentapeptide-transferase [Clostridium sp.]|nr:phospho-N-acetylmuramoyl-pentapeptide-transferase [Clostridium sp.]MCM1444585.1 phospho-N-acetylmuramoyl-pentapeptide-transferase [Candidatus Amulumruptor caecigallinarius]
MIILTKSIMAMMIGFIFSLITGFFLIPLLRKKKVNQSLSIYLEERHKKKIGTPTMGGLIFIIPTLICVMFMCIFKKININYTLILVIFTFISYSIIGFIDDFLIIKRNNNKGLSESMKFILQIIIAVIFFYIFMASGNEPLIWIHTFNIKINIGWFYGIFILLVLVASSNAVNITDGLDGLAGGLSLIAFITFSLISWNTGWLEGYSDIALFGFALTGSLLGFMVFNVSPAKIFMGDTGSLALGATLGTYAILTRHELLLLIIGFVFVIETLSCVIQRFYYKLTKKRLFPMTPIHHTFERLGWKEINIVRLFWIIGLIAAMCAISFGVLL